MKNRIEIPEELAHLVEKRDQAERRAGGRDDAPAAEKAPAKKAKAAERRRKDRRKS